MDAEMYDNFRRNVYKWRLLNKVSYAMLRGLADISEKRFSQMEHGKRTLETNELMRIRKTIKVPMKDLIKPCGAEPDLTKEERRQLMFWFEEERKAKKLTKFDWSKKLDVDAHWYSDCVNQFKVPSANQLNIMAINLGSSVRAILAEIKNRPIGSAKPISLGESGLDSSSL